MRVFRYSSCIKPFVIKHTLMKNKTTIAKGSNEAMPQLSMRLRTSKKIRLCTGSRPMPTRSVKTVINRISVWLYILGSIEQCEFGSISARSCVYVLSVKCDAPQGIDFVC